MDDKTSQTAFVITSGKLVWGGSKEPARRPLRPTYSGIPPWTESIG